MQMMRRTTQALFLALVIVGCGRQDGDVPPTKAGSSRKTFSLENGDYYVDKVWNIEDGCGRQPMDPNDPITSVSYQLENNGSGLVTFERCVFDGKSVQGYIQENQGVLTVTHQKREDEVDGAVARYLQECKLEITVKSDNEFEAVFTEYQRNRDRTTREVMGINSQECVTSYKMVMSKRD